METIKLARSGKRPIAFLGREIFKEDTEEKDARKIRVRIFETEDNDYRVGIARITYLEKEKDEYEVTKFRVKEEVLKFILKEVPEINLEMLTDALSNETVDEKKA